MNNLNPENPLQRLSDARQQARRANDPSARYCTMATLEEGDASQVRMRTLVCREITDDACVLYVNQLSRKNLFPLHLASVELLFFYPSLMQQFRLRGEISLINQEELEAHWQHKPYLSKLLDHYYHSVSEQSSTVTDRASLEKGIEALKQTFPDPDSVPFCDSAIGIRVSANYLEWWKGRDDGFHERYQYRLIDAVWNRSTLVP